MDLLCGQQNSGKTEYSRYKERKNYGSLWLEYSKYRKICFNIWWIYDWPDYKDRRWLPISDSLDFVWRFCTWNDWSSLYDDTKEEKRNQSDIDDPVYDWNGTSWMQEDGTNQLCCRGCTVYGTNLYYRYGGPRAAKPWVFRYYGGRWYYLSAGFCRLWDIVQTANRKAGGKYPDYDISAIYGWREQSYPGETNSGWRCNVLFKILWDSRGYAWRKGRTRIWYDYIPQYTGWQHDS